VSDDRIALENALLRIESVARVAVNEREDSKSWKDLRDALTLLDGVRSAIRARQKLRAGAGL